MQQKRTSLLSGRSKEQLQKDLGNAQNAYIALASGAQGESFTYAQGDGNRSVTYTRANIGQLVILIRQLQAELGIIPTARRRIRFVYK